METWNSRTCGSRGEQCEVQGVDGGPARRRGRRGRGRRRDGEMVFRARMRPQGQGSGSMVTTSVTSSRRSGWTRLYRLVTSSRRRAD